VTKQEIKTKWLEALRSGKYEQGAGHLCKNDKYCCLGVLCDIIGLDYKEENNLKVFSDKVNGDKVDKIFSLPYRILGDVHLNNPAGGYFELDGGSTSLALLNDAGKTFEEIADIIESEPSGLFNDTPKRQG